MELNWSTFILEIINFLILVWILKRFLYQPILDIIARRRQEIQNKLDNTKATQSQAETLMAQYENRLADWEQEKQSARKMLEQEIEAEQVRLMGELKTSLAQEREKMRVLEQRKLDELLRRNEQTALKQGAQFASRLLSRVAAPELEAQLCALLLEELAALPLEQQEKLHRALETGSDSVKVISAYVLDEGQRQALESTLNTVGGVEASYDYSQDAELLAGLRITLGSHVVSANLKDELKSLAEFAYESQ